MMSGFRSETCCTFHPVSLSTLTRCLRLFNSLTFLVTAATIAVLAKPGICAKVLVMPNAMEENLGPATSAWLYMNPPAMESWCRPRPREIRVTAPYALCKM